GMGQAGGGCRNYRRWAVARPAGAASTGCRGGRCYHAMAVARSGRQTISRKDMARGVNKVILLGNLGNDPDMKYTQGGMAIATLSVATTFSRKDRDGNFQEKTEWHRVKLFGKTAEVAGEYLKKGRQVYIEGRIEIGRASCRERV